MFSVTPFGTGCPTWRGHGIIGSDGLVLDMPFPIDDIPDRVDEILRDRLVGVFCSAGTRASIVYAYLRTRGYTDVRIVHGGYEAVVDAIEPRTLWQHLEQRKRP